MPCVYIYNRVSSKQQNQYNTVSLGMQLQSCEIYYESIYKPSGQYTLYHYSEVESARFLESQKQLLKVVSQVNPEDIIIVYNVSRFTRDASAAIDLLYNLSSRNINVVSVSEGISYLTNRNAFRLKLIEANEESDVISERVKNSINFIKSVGGHVGSTPYGFTTIRKTDQEGYQPRIVVPRETETLIINRIVQSVDDPAIIKIAESERVGICNVISNILNAEGITKRGKPWTVSSVLSVYTKYKLTSCQDNKDDTKDDNDQLCIICSEAHSETGNEMLLCDGCDRGFHLKCINYSNVPVNNFYCGIECRLKSLKPY